MTYGGRTSRNSAAHSEACGQAAFSGWKARFERKMGLVAGALFFCFLIVEAREMLWEVAERTLSFKCGA